MGGGCWPSCYCHRELSLLLSVYVDDSKMAGPSENLDTGWKLILGVVEVDPPQPLTLYLGCIHHRKTIVVGGRAFNVLEYDMGDFLKPTVQLYLEELPSTAKLPEDSSLPNKRAMPPCMPESHSDAAAAKAPMVNSGGVPCGPGHGGRR